MIKAAIRDTGQHLLLNLVMMPQRGAFMQRWTIAFLSLAFPLISQAGPCDTYLRKASTSEGETLVKAFEGLLKCDHEQAQVAFDDFMRGSKNVGTLVKLSITAIDAKAYTPIWNMLEKIPDYNTRDEIAKGVGDHCKTNDNVVTFIKGAYYGLRGRQFGQWEEALILCETEALTSWLEEVIVQPPKTTYDDKYNTVLTAYVKQRRYEALPVLERAAVASANQGGPFTSVLEKMDQAVQPGLGQSISEANRERLERSMATVASAILPEQAALVADRLFNAGSVDAAASLLPSVYPERVQSNDMFLYGTAAIESCDGEAIIHYAPVYEPAKRWSILADVEEPSRTFKPKLKCATEGEWPVLVTAEPLTEKSDLDTWAKDISTQWINKGLEVKLKSEKSITLN
jgi:hypothetical protein